MNHAMIYPRKEITYMFNEKIIYYRKKNMLTQEDLADKLCVSRQTITKWEKGIISPSLEYLIDLSHIFGVTIDNLIKEDDCLSETTSIIDTNHLIDFLITAKASTYAAHANKIESTRIDAHEYYYQGEHYQYSDTFFGGSYFTGQELIYENSQVCWSMNYYGKVLGDNFNSDFLKEALRLVSIQRPFRGPEMYTRGEYTYVSKLTRDIDFFQGSEEIYYQSHKIYEGIYHGGIIK